MAIEVFNRYEYKYIISSSQYKYLKEILDEKLILDDFCKQYSEYKIINYYVDTLNYQMIRDSLDKPVYKQKLRIRTYEELTSEKDFVYFEIKKKFKGLVNKRRCKMEYGEALEMIYKNKIPDYKRYMNKQILKEIHYILQKDIYELKSKISYDRIAYFSEDKFLRISFDFNIKSTTLKHLDNDSVLMEIKTPSSIPVWLVKVLNDYDIKSNSFSKYGLDFKNKLRKEIL